MAARISLTLGKARGHSYGCALSRLRSAAMAARCRACAPRLWLRAVAPALRGYGCALSRLRSAAMAARCRACAPRLWLRAVALALRGYGCAQSRLRSADRRLQFA